MILALVNGRVLTPKGLVDGVAVLVEDGRIARLANENRIPARARKYDLDGGTLAPGFIDVQVNGGGGVLFNDDPSVDSIAAIGAAHRRFGTTGFLPTLISADLDVVARAIEATRRAIEEGVPGVLGVHIEGPFLSLKRKGVHDAKVLRRLDGRSFKLVTQPTGGKTLITLAPEETDPAMIRRLARAGLVVSAGHTDATYEVVRAALDAGLTGFTHIFNAMSPLATRAPGAVGAALEDQQSWCGMIVDGHHVDPVVLRLALKCKPREKFMLVTDAMPSVGAARKTFQLQGRTIKAKNGVLVAPDGALAGADLDMASAVRNSVKLLGLSFEEAVAMASLHPAQFLGFPDRGAIAPGARADLVLLDDALKVRETWIGGISTREQAAATGPRASRRA
jgi:N-acetylglucosamine-6-phosphate deacetylase